MSPNRDPNRDVLISKDGEKLDGFQEVDDFDYEPIYAPVIKPTVRCKRCGCWLRASREDKSLRPDEEPPPPREYCSPCEEHMFRHMNSCAFCGETFFSENPGMQRCRECEAKYQVEKRTCGLCGEDFLPYVCMACKDKPQISVICHACHWQIRHAKAAAARERICHVCGCSFLPRACIVPECEAVLTDICSVCHEEIEHQGMTATIWTLPDCPRCETVFDGLMHLHRKVKRRSLEKLVNGDEPDAEALAHLVLTEGAAPLVQMDGRFLEPEEISALAEDGAIERD